MACVVQCITIQTLLCFALQRDNQEHLAEHRDPESEAESALLMPTSKWAYCTRTTVSPAPSFQYFLRMLIALPSSCLRLSNRPSQVLISMSLRSSIKRPMAVLCFFNCPEESMLDAGSFESSLVAVTHFSIVHDNFRFKSFSRIFCHSIIPSTPCRHLILKYRPRPRSPSL